MKYYKVIKEHPLFVTGAILIKEGQSYKVLDPIYLKDIPNSTSDNWTEGAELIKNCPEWFQRVYKVDLLTRVLYEVKDKALELLNKGFKDE